MIATSLLFAFQRLKVDIFWHLWFGRPCLANHEAISPLTLDVKTLSTGSTKLRKNRLNQKTNNPKELRQQLQTFLHNLGRCSKILNHYAMLGNFNGIKNGRFHRLSTQCIIDDLGHLIQSCIDLPVSTMQYSSKRLKCCKPNLRRRYWDTNNKESYHFKPTQWKAISLWQY